MRRSQTLLALAVLAAVPLVALGISRAVHCESTTEPKPSEEKKSDSNARPNVANESAESSEPGGTLVVLGLFAVLAALGTLVAAFVFPPGYVAAVLVFGLVSLLGLAVLFVHFRART